MMKQEKEKAEKLQQNLKRKSQKLLQWCYQLMEHEIIGTMMIDQLEGCSINNFEFLDIVGKRNRPVLENKHYGTTARVFKAKCISHPSSSQLPLHPHHLAIKVLFNYDIASHETFQIKEAFEHEVNISKKLPTHPSLLRILTSFVDLLDKSLMNKIDADTEFLNNKTLFIVSVLGEKTLKNVINELTEKRQYLRVDIFLFYLLQICSGIKIMNDYLIVHRDLKPDNILVTGEGLNGHLQIMDFGESWDARGDECDSLEMPYTVRGTPKGGSPAYLAPEVLNAQPGRRSFINYSKSDVYSIGCIVRDLLGIKTNNAQCTEENTPKEYHHLLPFLNSLIADFHQRPSVDKALLQLRCYLWKNENMNDELLIHDDIENKLLQLQQHSSVSIIHDYYWLSYIIDMQKKQQINI